MFLFSLKETQAESFRISRELMREVEREIDGATIPALAVAIDGGEVFVTLRGEDFLRLINSDQAQYVTPSRGDQKRARAKIPEILRDDE